MNIKVLGLFGIILISVAAAVFIHDPAPQTAEDLKMFVEVREITPAMKGLNKETRGVVTQMSEAKGHIFFTLKEPQSDKNLRCVLFAKTNRDDPTRKDLLTKSRDNNSVVYLRGEVDIYKGELELKVWQVYEK